MNKEHRCRFKIDKITYSKSSSRTTYDVSKNKPNKNSLDIFDVIS